MMPALSRCVRKFSANPRGFGVIQQAIDGVRLSNPPHTQTRRQKTLSLAGGSAAGLVSICVREVRIPDRSAITGQIAAPSRSGSAPSG
jgi:hypothetical protein